MLLTFIFQASIQQGIVPDEWKKSQFPLSPAMKKY